MRAKVLPNYKILRLTIGIQIYDNIILYVVRVNGSLCTGYTYIPLCLFIERDSYVRINEATIDLCNIKVIQ